MSTEVWIRNPNLCIRECLEAGVDKIVFDKGLLVNRHIDPVKFMRAYYGVSRPWRLLVIGDDGTEEYGSKLALYPTWVYGMNLMDLERMMKTNRDDRFEHRVIVSDLPDARQAIGKQFYYTLRELQQDYPDCILHVHGLYSFRLMFGMGFRATDMDPRASAAKGSIMLPNGDLKSIEMAAYESPEWINLMGFRPPDLKIPRNRCIYNIKSAEWAGTHYEDAIRFKSKGFAHIDPDDPARRKAMVGQRIMLKNVQAKEGDKFLCNVCSLQNSCRYYRRGAVCVVPGAEPRQLANLFNTRDSDTIIQGLGILLGSQAERLAEGMQKESTEIQEKGLDTDVTKLAKVIFDSGVKLAKLVNPALAAAGAARVNVNMGVQQINNGATPQAIMAAIINELEGRGINRDNITEEMLTGLLELEPADRTNAIDAMAVEKKTA